jgi:cytochrome c553
LLSPGTVLGVVALIVALAGTGVAASRSGSSGGSAKSAEAASSDQGTVAKKKKKKHHRKRSSGVSTSQVKSLADAEIKKLAPTLSVARATAANSANTATTANSAKIATNVYTAMINPDGSMLGSIPKGATSSKVGTGNYRVSFGRSIAGCTISGALAANGGPTPGMVGVGVADVNTVSVFVRDPTNTVVDLATYVQLVCPA